MEFKTFKKWEETEIKLLHENRFKFKHNQNGMFHLEQILKKKGYSRTRKAIERKCQKLQLVNFHTKDKTISSSCFSCKRMIEVKKRYYERDKKARCRECQNAKNREWDQKNKPRMKEYFHSYYLAHKDNAHLPMVARNEGGNNGRTV